MAAVIFVMLVASLLHAVRAVVEIDLMDDRLVLRTSFGSEADLSISEIESIGTTRWSGTRMKAVDGRSWAVSTTGAFVPFLTELHRYRPDVGATSVAAALSLQLSEQRLAKMRERFPWSTRAAIVLTALGLTGLNANMISGSGPTTEPTLFLGSAAMLLVGFMLAPVAFARAPELQQVGPDNSVTDP